MRSVDNGGCDNEQTQATNDEWDKAAELVTVQGWQCAKCKRLHTLDSDAGGYYARFCCTSHAKPCNVCGQPVGQKRKGCAKCKDCQDKADIATYLSRQPAEWDGKQMLCLDKDDRYFSSLDECLEHIADCEEIEYDAITQEHVEKYRVMLCVPHAPSCWDVYSEFEDYLAEDGDPPDGYKAVERVVNEWLDANTGNWSWFPGKYRLALR